jgi:hypothetical protein
MPRGQVRCSFALRDEGESAHAGAQDALLGGEHGSSGHVVNDMPAKTNADATAPVWTGRGQGTSGAFRD